MLIEQIFRAIDGVGFNHTYWQIVPSFIPGLMDALKKLFADDIINFSNDVEHLQIVSKL